MKASRLSNAQRFVRGHRLGVSPWIAAVAVATSTPAQAAPVSPTEASAQQLWSRLLTHCGESYFYAGSVFDHSGMLSGVGAGDHPSVIEFRGVKFNTVPIRVTDAERLNGISAEARVTMLAHVYREDGGDWQDGPDLQPRNDNDILGLALQNVVSDAGEMGDGGSMAFQVIQYEGKWLASRSGSDISGPLLSSAGFYTFDQLQGDAAPKYTCPQLSEKVQATLDAAAAADTRARHDAAIQSAWNAPEPTHDPRRGIPYLLITDRDVADLFAAYSHVGAQPPGPIRGDPQAAQAVIDRFPIIPTDASWLPVGTTFYTPYDFGGFGEGRRTLIVVKITSGPLAGHPAIIDADNYGGSFLTDPGRVWRDDAERKQVEQDARDDDTVLVRDPVRGVPYVRVTEDELAALVAAAQSKNSTFEVQQLEGRLGWRFINDPPNDLWLAPGTTFSPVPLGPASGSRVTSWYSHYQGKGLALVRVESGVHSGEAAVIDMRNYSNLHTICPPTVTCKTTDD